MIIIFFDRKDIQFTAGYHRVKSCIVTKFFDFVFGVSDFIFILKPLWDQEILFFVQYVAFHLKTIVISYSPYNHEWKW